MEERDLLLVYLVFHWLRKTSFPPLLKLSATICKTIQNFLTFPSHSLFWRYKSMNHKTLRRCWRYLLLFFLSIFDHTFLTWIFTISGFVKMKLKYRMETVYQDTIFILISSLQLWLKKNCIAGVFLRILPYSPE